MCTGERRRTALIESFGDLKTELVLLEAVVGEAREVVRAVADQAAAEGLDLADTAFGALAEALYLYDVEYGDDLDGDEVGEDSGLDPVGEVHPLSGGGDPLDDDPDGEDDWEFYSEDIAT